MYNRMSAALPYGSTALLRVDPQDYGGQEIVPAYIGRKAPSPWSREFAQDGMFSHGDTMVWIHDIALVDSPGTAGEIEFLVPEIFSVDNMRAVPLAALKWSRGQSLEDYMEAVPGQPDGALEKRYRMREDMIKAARSTAVLMSTKPESVFTDVDPAAFGKVQSARLSREDKRRAPLEKNLFDIGTLIRQGFQAPQVAIRNKRRWKGKKTFDARVMDIATLSDRRHYHKLEWQGTREELFLAGVPGEVDEGYVERRGVNPTETRPK